MSKRLDTIGDLIDYISDVVAVPIILLIIGLLGVVYGSSIFRAGVLIIISILLFYYLDKIYFKNKQWNEIKNQIR